MPQGKTIIYERELPDEILEWEGPDTPEGELEARRRFAQAAVEKENAKGPYTPPAHGGSALSDAANFVKGAVTAPVKGAIGLGEGLGETTGYALMGNPVAAGKRLLQLGKDTYHGIADPFEHGGQMVGEGINQMMGRTTQNPVLDEDRIASTMEGMGGAATGIATGVRAAKSPGLTYKGVAMSPEEVLMSKASKIREGVAKAPPILDSPGVVSTGLRTGYKVAKKVAGVRAPIYEKAAKLVAKTRTNPNGPTQTPTQDPFSVEALRSQPYTPSVETPAVETGIGGQVRNNRPLPEYADTSMDVNPYGEATLPAVDPFSPEGIQSQPFTPSPEIPAVETGIKGQVRNNMPMTEAAPEVQLFTPEQQVLRESLGAGGNSPWFGKEAQRVLDIAPELNNVPKGEGFKTRGAYAFNRVEAQMKAIQDSVPPETRVVKAPIVDKILALKDELVSANNPYSTELLKDIEKHTSGLDNVAPSMSWKEFLDIKEGLRKAPGFSKNPALRRAYGYFMDAASEISPELAKINKDFSTMMRLAEYGKLFAHIEALKRLRR